MKTAEQLQEEIDYHDYNESCAEAFGSDESAKYHRERRRILQAQRDEFFPDFIPDYSGAP